MSRAIFLLVILLSSHFVTADSNIAKVVILDTGLDLTDSRFKTLLCKEGHADFSGKGLDDREGHGTHLAGLITSHAKNAKYCLIIVKYFSVENNGFQNLTNFILALNHITKLKPDIVNISSFGPMYSQKEFELFKNSSKVKYFVAAGNEARDVLQKDDETYPAAYNLPNIFVVGNGKDRNNRHWTSNYGSVVTLWRDGQNIRSTLPNGKVGVMSGSSQSTAIYTGDYIYENYH